jgi:hypothetical protein
MKTITIQTEAKLATDLREFIDPLKMRKRIGMVYFQALSDGGLITRTISDETDKESLRTMIRDQKIFIPIKTITAEKS